MSTLNDKHDREETFHDQWAAETKVEDILVKPFFEAPTALENRFILKMMGALQGKRILDVGCGLGESSVYFALQGASVTALDLSPGMVESAMKLGKLHGVTLEGVVSEGEKLNVVDGMYDFVYLANTIHHVIAREDLYKEVLRVLKPGGRFFSWDPIAYNPAINIYRRMASKVRTEDETPLKAKDVAEIKNHFANVGSRTFWMLGLSLFLKYYFIDRIDPNERRYWKLIYEPQALTWWRPLAEIDRILCGIPVLRYLAWNIVIWGAKP